MVKGSSLPLPFTLGDALAEEAKALAEGSSLLLAGTGGVLVEELLAVGSLVPLVSLISEVFVRLLLFYTLPGLEVKEAPAVSGARMRTIFLRLVNGLGFTIVFCIELKIAASPFAKCKALIRVKERLHKLIHTVLSSLRR